MHHQEMHQDMEVDEDMDIKGEDPKLACSLDMASVARFGGHLLQSLVLPRLSVRCHAWSRSDRK